MKATRQKKVYTHMTEKDFANIKLLAQAGLTSKQIEDLTGRTNSTIGYVKKYDTFEQYQERIRENNLRRPKETPTPAIEAQGGLDEDLFKVLINIQDSLKEINNKIQWLADNKVIEVAPKKFGLF